MKQNAFRWLQVRDLLHNALHFPSSNENASDFEIARDCVKHANVVVGQKRL